MPSPKFQVYVVPEVPVGVLVLVKSTLVLNWAFDQVNEATGRANTSTDFVVVDWQPYISVAVRVTV